MMISLFFFIFPLYFLLFCLAKGAYIPGATVSKKKKKSPSNFSRTFSKKKNCKIFTFIMRKGRVGWFGCTPARARRLQPSDYISSSVSRNFHCTHHTLIIDPGCYVLKLANTFLHFPDSHRILKAPKPRQGC